VTLGEKDDEDIGHVILFSDLDLIYSIAFRRAESGDRLRTDRLTCCFCRHRLKRTRTSLWRA